MALYLRLPIALSIRLFQESIWEFLNRLDNGLVVVVAITHCFYVRQIKQKLSSFKEEIPI